MSADIKSFLTPRQLQDLEIMGRKGDKWNELLRETGGDENLAMLLASIRGVEVLGETPSSKKPKLEGPSPRVAAQKHAAKRLY